MSAAPDPIQKMHFRELRSVRHAYNPLGTVLPQQWYPENIFKATKLKTLRND